MIRALIFAALGAVLVCVGFVASPWPWVAPISLGALFLALGVLGLFRTEVDE